MELPSNFMIALVSRPANPVTSAGLMHVLLLVA
jgi:hypothetical protein